MIAVKLFSSHDGGSSLAQVIIPQTVEQRRIKNCSGEGREQYWLILSSDISSACQLLRKIVKDFMVGESQAQFQLLPSAERMSVHETGEGADRSRRRG